MSWQLETTLPTEEGWHRVKRADGTLCVRAFGHGMWWIPLRDGWLSGLPSGFAWRGPAVPFGGEKGSSPFDDLARAEEVFDGLDFVADQHEAEQPRSQRGGAGARQQA